MISSAELTVLLGVLKDEDKPLEAVGAAFAKAFPRADHFRLACAMCALLVDGLITLPTQRLAALFVLHDLYRAEPLASQPFLPFLVEQLGRAQEGPSARVEHNLLCLLLADPPNKDMPKRSALEIRASLAAGEPLPVPNLRAMQAAFAERDQHIPPLRRRGIHATVFAPAAEDEVADADALATAAARGEALSEGELSLASFEPAFARPPPPLLAASEDEVVWLSPCTEGTSLLWDNSLCSENVKSLEVRELMGKAFKVCAAARSALREHMRAQQQALRSARARSACAAAGCDVPRLWCGRATGPRRGCARRHGSAHPAERSPSGPLRCLRARCCLGSSSRFSLSSSRTRSSCTTAGSRRSGCQTWSRTTR